MLFHGAASSHSFRRMREGYTWLLLAALCVTLSACSSLTFLVANTPAAFGRYSQLKDLSYANRPRNKLDVYIPEGLRDKVPVVIFVHGGGWNSGDKAQYKFVGAALAEQGYVAVLPNYGLYPHVKSPVFIQDVARAIVWVHAHASEWNGDSGRIYLIGHSAGAHIAVMLALDKEYMQQAGGDAGWLSGVVGLAGPYDFLPFTYPYMNDLFGPPERFAASQPVNYVRADAPPLLLLQGLQDHTVAPTNTRRLYEMMKSAGGRVHAEYFEHATHSDLIAAFSFLRNREPPVMKDIKSFIDANAVTASAVSGMNRWPR